MKKAAAIALLAVRLTGMIQVVIGLAIWGDHWMHLLPAHMVVGMTFVVALWVLAGLAAWAGLERRFTILAAGWGLVIPAFGMSQLWLLPGPAHWVVELLHLLIGLAAMVGAHRLARFIRTSPRGDRRGAAIGAAAPRG